MDLSSVCFSLFTAQQVQQALAAFNALPMQGSFREGQYIHVPKRLTPGFLAENLGCAISQAEQLLRELVDGDYLDALKLVPSTKGMALIHARSLPRIPRSDAEAIVTKLVEVAVKVNGRPGAKVFIECLEIFGSFVTGTSDLGDVDVRATIPPPLDMMPEDFEEMDMVSDELQAVSPYVSLHPEFDPVAAAAPRVVIYERKK